MLSLEYANSVWNPDRMDDVEPLLQVEVSATKIVESISN